MKTLFICPNQANGIPVLADTNPLATLPVLGAPFICYWIEHLAASKLGEARILCADAPELIEECAGDGSRWGVKLEYVQELRDLKPEDARNWHRPPQEAGWAPEPDDVIEANHLPGLPEHKLFSDYAAWFKAMGAWLPRVVASNRIGLREIEPGVWVGRRCRISAGVKFQGPCWLGDRVSIGRNAVIGPFAFLENQVVAEHSCEIAHSWVGPDTFIGALTHLKDSLAWGSLLINWKNGSHTIVPDSFLLASLAEGKKREERKVAPAAASAPATPLSRPFGTVISLAQKLQG